CAAFLLSAIAFAAEKPASTAAADDPGKIGNVKVAKMNARGKVVEITDKTIKIERKVKNDVEIMEFVLDKPMENIVVSDAVKIVYVEKDGSLMALRVVKIIPKKYGKKEIDGGKTTAPKK
ncbi:MAG: hypothetical protein HGA29_08615, partial [Syntrophaceae bacterium]|nr:hypothetical protein [Syntrophaceae bacterium]